MAGAAMERNVAGMEGGAVLGSRAASKDLMELGNRIRERRQEMRMSQEAVAKKAGISANTVSRIEGGQTAMSIEIFVKLAEILETDADALIGGILAVSEGDGWCRDILCRMNGLKRCEQEVVIQTVNTLVQGLRRCQ